MGSEGYFLLPQDNATNYNVDHESGVCDACGALTVFEYLPIINAALAKQWGLNIEERRLWSARESMYCAFCGCSYRLRLLARAINVVMGNQSKSLMQLVNEDMFLDKAVAEVNSCGTMHDILKKIPNLQYSEYKPENEAVMHQDLQHLTYRDNTFDYLFTSDVLEHVPDPVRALSEIYRVLRPGGCTVMSVPVIMNRKTKTRAQLVDDQIVYKERPSYHGSGESDYLVWNEFGYDFIDFVTKAGFLAYYLFVNTRRLDDPTGIIIAYKSNTTRLIKQKLTSAVAVQFDKDWQLQRIRQLKYKQKLSQQHIINLEAMIEGYKTEQTALHTIITQQEEELSEYRAGVLQRLSKKMSIVIKKNDKKIE